MIGLQRREAVAAIAGVLRLSRFDLSGIANFNPSVAACKRSFWAAAGYLPAFYLSLLLQGVNVGSGGIVETFVAQTIGFVILCLAFPLGSERVMAFLGQDTRWPLLVTTYNWMSFVQSWAIVILLVIFHGGFLGDAGTAITTIFGYFCLAVEGFIFSAVLGGQVGLAIALLLLDYTFGRIIQTIADSMS